jgi:hypothetical protein
MVHRTAEEALSNYKEKMGDKLGEIFHRLLQDTYHVCSIWDQHETLFERRERITLLNSSGGFFFGNVQRIFFDYTLLAISRLTDPARSGTRKNLTIRCLPPLVGPHVQPRLEELIDIAVDKSTFCRDWRNRKIAHNDLDQKLEVGSPLAAATRRSVTDTLIAIQDVLRLPAVEFCDTNIGFIEIGDDAAIDLLHQIYYGKKFTDERLGKLRRRAWNDVDLGVPEWLNLHSRFDRYSRNEVS